jgi:ketosteroid isomerase-like protein
VVRLRERPVGRSFAERVLARTNGLRFRHSFRWSSGAPHRRDTPSAMVNVMVDIRNDAVRKLFDAFEGESDAFQRTLDPDIEWCPIDENRVPLRGVEAAVRNRNAWLETWDEHRLDVEEVVEDGDSVVASIHITGRGKRSGASAEVRFYAQFKVRDDRVAYIYDHEDRTAALQAAGLGNR